MSALVFSPLPFPSVPINVASSKCLPCLLRPSSRFHPSVAAAKMSSSPEPKYPPPVDVDCVGTGTDVECFFPDSDPSTESSALLSSSKSLSALELETTLPEPENPAVSFARAAAELGLLVSPFFFWGTAMVAMKGVIPKTGPFFVAAVRLLPAGSLLVAFAAVRRRPLPSGALAWASIAAFAAIDAACFQGFLAQGLMKTSAGLGSVIIDSQPLTVAILAALLFGESIDAIGAAGLVLGVVGLLLLEIPVVSSGRDNFTLWGTGEWWMLLAAQSMAIGTVMVRWVSKYSDPIMATGWHMIIGGLPLLIISALYHDPALNGSLTALSSEDLFALFYTSVFGSAISYGVYYYNATRGSLTKLSSLTFLTPMFASLFGFVYLGETFTPIQFLGAFITLLAIYMVNYRSLGSTK